MHRYYQFLDDQLNESLSINVGFENLTAAGYHSIDLPELQGFFERHALIKAFQETTLKLFRASLAGEFDPEVADLVINELPRSMGHAYHARLTDRQHRTPLFYRTDEVAPGIIGEIQCPGSAWGLYEQLFLFYQAHKAEFGEAQTFTRSLSAGFSASVRNLVGDHPRIHHLLDNASIPHGMRFFIQRTRQHGLTYFGYDKAATPYDCNLVRSHDFVSLFHNNFAQRRLLDCEDGRLVYDLPPSALFEQKVIYAFPFWSKTRSHYSDAIRGMFPFTQLIRPEGVTLEDGSEISLEAFSRLSQKQRPYFFKYGGCDLALNWGSKGVFYAGSLSQVKTREMLDGIIKGYGRKKYWILQKSHLHANTVRYLTREGNPKEAKAYAKYSGFYGPEGLMGLLVMERPFHKVHGTQDTIVSICR